MLVVEMLDRTPDSLSEALMHKMPSSRVRRARCLSLATWLPSTPPRSPPQTPRPLDLQTDRRGGGETREAARCQGSRGKASQNKALASEEFLLIPQTKEARLRWGSYLFPKQKEARLRGFLLIFYRSTFVHQDFPSPLGYLGYLRVPKPSCQ